MEKNALQLVVAAEQASQEVTEEDDEEEEEEVDDDEEVSVDCWAKYKKLLFSNSLFFILFFVIFPRPLSGKAVSLPQNW